MWIIKERDKEVRKGIYKHKSSKERRERKKWRRRGKCLKGMVIKKKVFKLEGFKKDANKRLVINKSHERI